MEEELRILKEAYELSIIDKNDDEKDSLTLTYKIAYQAIMDKYLI